MNILEHLLNDLLFAIEPLQSCHSIEKLLDQKTIIKPQSILNLLLFRLSHLDIKTQLIMATRLQINLPFSQLQQYPITSQIFMSNLVAFHKGQILTIGQKMYQINRKPLVLFDKYIVYDNIVYNYETKKFYEQIHGFVFTYNKLFLYNQNEIYFYSKIGRVQICEFEVYKWYQQYNCVIFIARNGNIMIIDEDCNLIQFQNQCCEYQYFYLKNKLVQIKTSNSITLISSSYYLEQIDNKFLLKDANLHSVISSCDLNIKTQLLYLYDRLVFMQQNFYFQVKIENFLNHIQ